MNWKTPVGIAVLALVVIFTLQNAETVEVRFLLWQFSLSRVLLIVLLLATGMLLGWLLTTLARIRKK